MLVGFDFPFGYPAGTARKLTGRDGWEAIWSRIAEAIKDHPDNTNNRFDAAASLNDEFQGDGPFWGNGLRRDVPGLPRTKPPSGWGRNLPANLRHAESEVKGAQEVWKLNGAGSVGGQALTGIAALEGLRGRAGVQVWPFETLGEGRAHVLAEIYPSLIEPDRGQEVKDAGQVAAVAAALQNLDESGELERHLRAPNRMPAAVREEEGLILGMQDPSGFQRAARRPSDRARTTTRQQPDAARSAVNDESERWTIEVDGKRHEFERWGSVWMPAGCGSGCAHVISWVFGGLLVLSLMFEYCG